MIWERAYKFKDTVAAATFVKSLPLCRRYGWNESRVHIIVEEQQSCAATDALAAKAEGVPEADWLER